MNSKGGISESSTDCGQGDLGASGGSAAPVAVDAGPAGALTRSRAVHPGSASVVGSIYLRHDSSRRREALASGHVLYENIEQRYLPFDDYELHTEPEGCRTVVGARSVLIRLHLAPVPKQPLLDVRLEGERAASRHETALYFVGCRERTDYN